MTEKQPRPEKHGVTRRAFVTGVAAGTAGAALALSSSSDLLAAVLSGTSESAAAHRPRAGALYYPWYRYDGTNWNMRGRVPALGRYDSGDRGVLDTHVTWVLAAGLDFLLVADTDATTRSTSALYERAAARGLDLGLMIVPGNAITRDTEHHASSRPSRQYMVRTAAALRARLEGVVKRAELRSRNYLKDRNGRAVVALRAWDKPAVMEEIVAEAQRNIRGPFTLWTIPELANEPSTVCPSSSKVLLFSASASPVASQLRDAEYLVIDSFNDWRRGRSTIEPSAAEGRKAPARLASLRTVLGIA